MPGIHEGRQLPYRAAGMFDLSHMGELELSGPEAGAALDYALVSMPSRMQVGQARYSMLVSRRCAKSSHRRL